MKLYLIHIYLHDSKDSDGSIKMLKIVQGAGRCQILEIWKQVLLLINWRTETQMSIRLMEDRPHTNWE